MSREVHAPFCERVGVRLPRATLLVAVLACKDDAERVLRVLGKRMGKYGLQLHPDKTRLVDFRIKKPPTTAAGETALATIFHFLGFVHVWGRSRKGNPVVRQQTAKDRFARALKAINEKCRRMRHEPLPEQHRQLSQTLKGHFAYFGISGNSKRLSALRYCARRIWRTWLSRRSTKSQVSWDRFSQIEARFPLPQPRIVHNYAGL